MSALDPAKGHIHIVLDITGLAVREKLDDAQQGEELVGDVGCGDVGGQRVILTYERLIRESMRV